MQVNTELLLRKVADNIKDGSAHQVAGRTSQAQQHYLQAADFLFKAASQSEGDIRLLRTRKAEQILEQAKKLSSPAKCSDDKIARGAHLHPAGDSDESNVPWLVTERPSVRFDDVVGLDEAKREIHLKLIYPLQFPERASKYRILAGGGILLYGPPGTGKTMFARAVAGEVDAAFYHVKPSDIMSKWVGEAEQNTAKLFGAARQHPRSVIFIDEIEALVPRRRDSSSTVMKRVVPQFLAELEGFDKRSNCLLFIGATNEPWELDPAILRPGRFDVKIYVPLPDAAARRRIVELHLAELPVAEGLDPRILADTLEGFSGADIVNVCAKATQRVFLESIQTGVDREILERDFHEVLEGTRPSVAASDLARYVAFASAH